MSLPKQPRGVMNGGHLLLKCRRRRHLVCTTEMVCECEVALEQVAQPQHRIPETTTTISQLLNLPEVIPRYHPLCPLRDHQLSFLARIHQRNLQVAQLLVPSPYHLLPAPRHKLPCPARSALRLRSLSMRHVCENETRMLWRSTRTGSGVGVELQHLQMPLHRMAATHHLRMACQSEQRTISPHWLHW